MDTLAIQKQLAAVGFDPGEADGIFGARTRQAVAAFQAARGIDVQWPGTVGPRTMAALFDQPVPGKSRAAARPWFDLARQKLGLHEGSDHAALSRFLRSDGKTLGDPAKLPWCGDLVATCIALTLPDEPQPANPYLARNWLKFGVESDPTLGTVAVFWRGARSGTSGHVGFVAGYGDQTLYILGGNQSNRISVAPLKRNRLLGCRWPATVEPGPMVLAKMDGGRISIDEA